jgi:capsular polysaccharide biosynthesis protein
MLSATNVLSPTELSLEEQLHGGYLHLTRTELSRRLQESQPSLYDCLLAAIYFRKSGDQKQAMAVLDRHAESAVFDASYNRLQSLCHALDFRRACSTAEAALARWSAEWNEQQRGYAQDVSYTAAALCEAPGFPTELENSWLEANGYLNLDSGEATPCTGLVGHNRRLARCVSARFEPESQCWLETANCCVIQELLQPNHDFRSFFGGAMPWRVDGNRAADPDDAPRLSGVAVFVESNPHYGHFLTQSASFANALSYAEHLLPTGQNEIVVLSKEAIPLWGQQLLQAGSRKPLRFAAMNCNQPLMVDCLVVAPPTWIEWHYGHQDHTRLFRKAAQQWLRTRSSDRRRLYLSRSHLGECLRRSVNEAELEAALERRGFEVVHPQEIPLPEMAQLVNEAGLIVGAMGSAMHNVLFRLPEHPLITLNLAHHLPGINNALVERCSGIRQNLYLRSCDEEETTPGQPSHLHFRLQTCLEGVDQALDQLEQMS